MHLGSRCIEVMRKEVSTEMTWDGEYVARRSKAVA